MSVAQPRISPDGRWLYFCATRYSCWPIYDPYSDIYGIDLEQGRQTGKFEYHKLDINSDQTESIVNWSSNSKWIVFSSKRGTPLFTRPYLTHVAPDGKNSKPIVLPQEDPEFYDSFLFTYTLPTLATGPVSVSQKEIIRAITTPNKPTIDVRETK